MATFTNDVIAVQKWWMGELQALTRKVISAEEKRKQKAREKGEKGLGEYRTYNDIQEAYGVGAITERKMDKLVALLEEKKKAEWSDRQYEMKLDILRELYETSKRVIQDQEKGGGN